MNTYHESLQATPTNNHRKNFQAAHAVASAPFGKGFLSRHVLKVALGCLLAIGVVGLSACSNNVPANNSGAGTEEKSSAQNSTVIAEGAVAPDFTFTTVEGETVQLSDYKGSVVLLNFWATWCGYCIDEMPAMQQLTENYADDVVILAVNRGDSASEAKTFAQDSSYNFVWGLDEDGAIQDLYPSNGIPYSIVIDKEGVIGSIFEGSAADMYPYFEEAVTSAGA